MLELLSKSVQLELTKRNLKYEVFGHGVIRTVTVSDGRGKTGTASGMDLDKTFLEAINKYDYFNSRINFNFSL